MQGKKIILTEDGSHTVFSERFQSTYHSTHGAIQESKHVFIKHGIEYYQKSKSRGSISILEYGFGTGLNALLTLEYSIKNNLRIEYTGIEAYPLSIEEYKKLNYLDSDFLKSLSDQFNSMHLSIDKVDLSPNFTFTKSNLKFEDFDTKNKFDIIYFDAFSPDIQGHLWERPFLDQVINHLTHNGILITYGAKGSFKRALKSLGMIIENPPGPPGKREITRGIMNTPLSF